MCGENGYLYNYNSTVAVPGVGNVTCYEIYSLGATGSFGPPGPVCETIGLAISSTCCSPEIRYICPNDADVTRPDLGIPGTGDPLVTCAQVQEYGRQGLIPPLDCLAAQAGTPLVCGCGESETTGAPSDPPGMETTPLDSNAPSDAPGAEPPPPESSVPSDVATDPPVVPTEPPATDPPEATPTQPPIEPTEPPETDPPDSSSHKYATTSWIAMSLLYVAVYMSAA